MSAMDMDYRYGSEDVRIAILTLHKHRIRPDNVVLAAA